MRGILFNIFFFLAVYSTGQSNLVPNPSFEDYSSCPTGLNQVSNSIFWNSPNTATPDYYHGCTASSVLGVPNNNLGYQNAYSGIAYAAIIAFIHDGFYFEYISTQLITPLDPNVKYSCEFYISTANLSPVGINRLGMFISPSPYFQNNDYMLPFSPQIENDSNSIISDTLNWTKISGEYLAQGGEQYIIIGNFYPINQTDTAHVNYSSPGTYYAYYYIDNVSITEILDSTDTVQPIDSTIFEISIFPNPNNGEFVLNYNLADFEEGVFKIYNAIGQIVFEEKLIQNNGVSNFQLRLASGAYVWEVRSQDAVLKRERMIVVK
jgi:hypothetical protein